MNDRTLAWLALNLIDGIGPARCRRLVEHFGAPERIWQASAADWSLLTGLNVELAERLRAFPWKDAGAREWDKSVRTGCRVLTWDDPEYPTLLKADDAPPPVLYIKGAFLPADAQALGVVGCRKPSPYGLRTTEELTTQLVQTGFTIVSGLALGIDAAAHQAALRAGGRTLAVVATGADLVYPSEHAELAERIAENGAVVSEFPLGTPPHKINFPRRNRIISGLARGVLVVEAGRRSGALITAQWAADSGREVFAVPGTYTSPTSAGTHALIQQGAKLVTGLTDILEELEASAATRSAPARPAAEGLSETQARVLRALAGEGRHVDQLCADCGVPMPRLLADLLTLEMRGQVRSAPGGVYTGATG